MRAEIVRVYWGARMGCCGSVAFVGPVVGPHLPAAGTSSVSSFNEELQADLLVVDLRIARHAMDVNSNGSLLARARAEDLLGIWVASSDSRIAVFGIPRAI